MAKHLFILVLHRLVSMCHLVPQLRWGYLQLFHIRHLQCRLGWFWPCLRRGHLRCLDLLSQSVHLRGQSRLVIQELLPVVHPAVVYFQLFKGYVLIFLEELNPGVEVPDLTILIIDDLLKQLCIIFWHAHGLLLCALASFSE